MNLLEVIKNNELPICNSGKRNCAFGIIIALAAIMIFPSQAAPMRVYDVDDYVQSSSESLVMHLDGVRNAGAMSGHDSAATTWIDLTGKHTLTAGGETPSFVKDAWIGNGSSYFTTESDAAKNALVNKAFTLEMVISHTKPLNRGYEYWVNFGDHKTRRNLIVSMRLNESEIKLPLIQCVEYREGNWHYDRSVVPESNLTKWGERQYVAIVCDSTGATTYINGANKLHLNVGGELEPTSNAITIGAAWNQTYPILAGGEICAMRMTTRAMTTAELESNWAVDKERFINNHAIAKDGIAANVIVAVDSDIVANAAGCGKYVAQNGDIFKAPAKFVDGNDGYTLAGYTLETWDGSTWSTPVAHDGKASYTATGSGLVRLTWRYRHVLVAASGYDKYVQSSTEALVMQLDGLANGSTTTWMDLTGNHEFTVCGGTPSFANGAWQADGKTYFTTTSDSIKNAIAAKAFTLEMMISRAVRSSPKTYEYWFTSANANGSQRNLIVEMRQADAQTKNPLINAVEYREVKWEGGDRSRSLVPESSITKWGERQYVAVVCDENGAATYACGANKIHTTVGGAADVESNAITIGAAWNQTYPLLSGGEICAMRMTARALTTDEIERNNRVDMLRFAGKGDVTIVNGAIGDTSENGACSVADGVYNIDSDSWTFTADKVTKDGETYSPRLVVETWNGEEWIFTSREWAEAYTVVHPVTKRLRLKWTWEVKKGLVIIFK